MCPVTTPLLHPLPYVIIPPKLTNPSGLSWRVPNFDIRNRLK